MLPPLALPRSGSAGRWRRQPPSQPGWPELPVYADGIVSRAVNRGASVRALVDELSKSSLGTTFNQYREGPRAGLLRRRLGAYLEARAGARLLLVGEAAGYRGARVSGVPFTSERQLSGRGPSEATATIVHRVLAELGLEEGVLLWNVVPTHPGTASRNRPPTRAEVAAGAPFVELLAGGRSVIAVGRVAERVLGATSAVRHPSHGGAREFRAGLVELLAGGASRTA